MRIASIILRVQSLADAKAFWSDRVGLHISMEAPGFVFMENDGVRLTLNGTGEPVDDRSLTEVVFESDDVRRDHADMVARGVPFELDLRPVTASGNRQLLAAHFRDPDGHVASLTGWVPADDTVD